MKNRSLSIVVPNECLNSQSKQSVLAKSIPQGPLSKMSTIKSQKHQVRSFVQNNSPGVKSNLCKQEKPGSLSLVNQISNFGSKGQKYQPLFQGNTKKAEQCDTQSDDSDFELNIIKHNRVDLNDAFVRRQILGQADCTYIQRNEEDEVTGVKIIKEDSMSSEDSSEKREFGMQLRMHKIREIVQNLKAKLSVKAQKVLLNLNYLSKHSDQNTIIEVYSQFVKNNAFNRQRVAKQEVKTFNVEVPKPKRSLDFKLDPSAFRLVPIYENCLEAVKYENYEEVGVPVGVDTKKYIREIELLKGRKMGKILRSRINARDSQLTLLKAKKYE